MVTTPSGVYVFEYSVNPLISANNSVTSWNSSVKSYFLNTDVFLNLRNAYFYFIFFNNLIYKICI